MVLANDIETYPSALRVNNGTILQFCGYISVVLQDVWENFMFEYPNGNYVE